MYTYANFAARYNRTFLMLRFEDTGSYLCARAVRAMLPSGEEVPF